MSAARCWASALFSWSLLEPWRESDVGCVECGVKCPPLILPLFTYCSKLAGQEPSGQYAESTTGSPACSPLGSCPFFFLASSPTSLVAHLHLHIHPDAADRNGYAAHFIQGDTPLCRTAASAFVSHCWPTRGSDSSLTTGSLSSRQPETSLPQKWQGKETPGVFVPNLPSEKRDGGLSVV